MIKILGVIPARWASSRFEGKSIVPLCGKPLIRWVIERARQAKRLDEVIVATDDDRIRLIAEQADCRVIMTRSDLASGTDRVAQAVKIFGGRPEAIINIQGDEPLVDPNLIDRLAEVITAERSWDMVTAAAPIACEADLNNKAIVKVVFGDMDQALYFSRLAIPFVRDTGIKSNQPIHWRHIGIYLYSLPFLERLVHASPCLLEQVEKLEQLRALSLGARIKIVKTSQASLAVDTPSDVKVVESAIKQAGLG